MPELSPETWAQIRYEYEHTDRPIADICAERGISDTTLRDRRRRWHWTPRRAPIPREGPPAAGGARVAAALPDAQRRASLPPTLPLKGRGSALTCLPRPGETPSPDFLAKEGRKSTPSPQAGRGDASPDPAALAPRLQSAVARVLPAIEATLAKLAASPQRPRELEQTARALGALMRTLRELNALLAQQPARRRGLRRRRHARRHRRVPRRAGAADRSLHRLARR